MELEARFPDFQFQEFLYRAITDTDKLVRQERTSRMGEGMRCVTVNCGPVWVFA